MEVVLVVEDMDLAMELVEQELLEGRELLEEQVEVCGQGCQGELQGDRFQALLHRFYLRWSVCIAVGFVTGLRVFCFELLWFPSRIGFFLCDLSLLLLLWFSLWESLFLFFF